MVAKPVVPHVSDETTDRSIKALDSALSEVIKSPMVNGVLLKDVSAGEDGPLTVHHGLGRTAVGAMVVSADRGAYLVSLVSSDSSSAKLSVTPQWELMERKDVVVTSTTFDFETGVNGDEDNEYRIDGHWNSNVVSTTLGLRINGTNSSALTNCHTRYEYSGVTATATGMLLAAMVAAIASEHKITSRFALSTALNRLGNSQVAYTNFTAATNTYSVDLASKWEETSTKVTTLGLYTGVVNGILSGSHFTLYRKPRLAGRKLNIWIF